MKRYCVDCGNRMNQKLIPLAAFDEQTGKPVVDSIFVCPNQRWWKFRHQQKRYTRAFKESEETE